MEKIFSDLGIEIILAAVLGIVAKLLKQPLIAAYILAGFILGPAILGMTPNAELNSLFSTIGVAFLLFTVGLELSINKIKEAGKKVLFIGMIQILATALLGYIFCILIGFNNLSSLYIGGLLSFSSTIIVVNLLTEKKAISSLYGKISIGVLVLQDIVALLLMVFLSGFSAEKTLSVFSLSIILFKGFVLFAIVYLIGHFFISKLFKYLAHHTDLLFLFSIAWCFAVSGIFSYLGFSIEMGAFVAGVSLANMAYTEEMTLKLLPLRDFFLILFFITLGSEINWSGMGNMIVPIILLVLFVLIVKSLVTFWASLSVGFSKRTSFYSAMSLSQVSEFSLIIAAIGLSLGHINKDISSIIIIVTIITILLSSYLITFLGNIYNALRKPLSVIGFLNKEEEREDIPKMKNHIILFGYHRLGKQIFASLEKISKKIIIVDLDPDVVENLNHMGKHCIYGDAYNPELLEKLNIAEAKMIVSTFPGKKSSKFLIKKIKSTKSKSKIIIMAEHSDDAIYLYKHGADYVILPHHLSGEHVSGMLDGIRKKKTTFNKLRNQHLISIKKYKDTI